MATRSRTTQPVRAGQPRQAPPDECRRQAPFALRADPEGGEDDGYTLDGYAAVFRRTTIIDSWEGRFREQTMPGSMRKSFRENPPKIQFDHGQHPLIGSIPIAALLKAEEDADPDLAPDGGAHVIGSLFRNWLVEPVRDAIRERAVNGMSFRFGVVRERWEDPDGKIVRSEKLLAEYMERTWWEDVPDEELWTRSLLEVKVPELGPVTWPAYAETSVAVRSLTVDAETIMRDPGARRELARFVLLADLAEARQSDTGEEVPPGTVETPESPAAEHTATEPATPPSTETPEQETPAVGHVEPPSQPPSTPTRAQRNLAVRLRQVRDVVLHLPD
jgi:uncharacterized protein